MFYQTYELIKYRAWNNSRIGDWIWPNFRLLPPQSHGGALRPVAISADLGILAATKQLRVGKPSGFLKIFPIGEVAPRYRIAPKLAAVRRNTSYRS
ncbi:hypothetical protein ACXHXG_06590 [Rhizobium sp. LEGMi198b]|uniref:hypothetical protein n=1 Tax=unclassified Rhizobium TaxID=2613769 RepID=UPI00131A5F86|nr:MULTISPECIES: hypothetical protein [Rhizobium]UWU21170.1 hypothetical protein N2601_18320 [Rhizobium tropici]WFU01974.1 hypothetical protein QA648_18030 [Rhizobium sp. CB3171]